LTDSTDSVSHLNNVDSVTYNSGNQSESILGGVDRPTKAQFVMDVRAHSVTIGLHSTGGDFIVVLKSIYKKPFSYFLLA